MSNKKHKELFWSPESQITNLGLNYFFAPHFSEYERKVTLFDTTQKRIVWIRLVMMYTIIYKVPTIARQLITDAVNFCQKLWSSIINS